MNFIKTKTIPQKQNNKTKLPPATSDLNSWVGGSCL
jgi:hypothetical protein